MTSPATLFVLIGIQGAGKSTWARANAERLGAVIVASDAIRNELESAGRDATDLSDEVFAVLEARVAALLAAGQSVLADATHARRDWRRKILAIARQCGARRVAIWFDLPYAELQARNQRKPGGGWGDRVIPEALLQEYWSQFEPPGEDEFDEVWKLT